MNAIQIIGKEISKVSKSLKRVRLTVEKQRSVLKESERQQASLQKRIRQLEDARQAFIAEQDKLLKSTGLSIDTAPPVIQQPAS